MDLYYILTLLTVSLNRWTYVTAMNNVDFSGYDKWTPPGQPGNEIFCPNRCGLADRCCSCEAKRCWELNATACGVVIGQLYVEYMDSFGTGIIVADRSVPATLYELNHAYGRLTSVPDNMCTFANQTISINLSYNRLTEIAKLDCMTKLDKLILDGNKIKYVQNTTFSRMEQLRILSMSNNRIERLDSNTIAIKQGNIFTVDISYNEMEAVDVTNIYRNGPFCSISYEGSDIKTTTNELNFTVTDGLELGPGTINFNKTQMTTFVDYRQLGITDISDLEKYVKGRIYIDESSIHCDCNLYPYFNDLGKSLFDLWGNLEEGTFVCRSPEYMKGFNASAIFDTNSTDRLVCDITVQCPRYCKCIDKPNDNIVLVNCSWAGFRELPAYMPDGNFDKTNIDLRLDGNDIEVVEYRSYVNRLVHLDLTYSKITAIENDFAKHMNDKLTIEFENQLLTNLPRYFQTRKPTNFKFGTHPIMCNCENVWVGEWMRFYSIRNNLFCKTGDRVTDSALVSDQIIGCTTDEANTQFNYLFISVVSILIIVAVAWTTYVYRYEIMLLKRKYLTNRTNNVGIKYDVFLSFCEDDVDVFSWVYKVVLRDLEEAGYKVFCPWFNLVYGVNRSKAVALKIRLCRHHVVCLCAKYQSDPKCVVEFDNIWQDFVCDESKKITVINFTPLNETSIKDKRLRAFRKIRDDLNFKLTESKLFDRLKKRIGAPRKRRDAAQHRVDQHANEFNNEAYAIGIHDRLGDDNNSEVHANEDHDEPSMFPLEKTVEHNTDPHLAVFRRLSQKSSTCNRQHRKCYLGPHVMSHETKNKVNPNRPTYLNQQNISDIDNGCIFVQSCTHGVIGKWIPQSEIYSHNNSFVRPGESNGPRRNENSTRMCNDNISIGCREKEHSNIEFEVDI